MYNVTLLSYGVVWLLFHKVIQNMTEVKFRHICKVFGINLFYVQIWFPFIKRSLIAHIPIISFSLDEATDFSADPLLQSGLHNFLIIFYNFDISFFMLTFVFLFPVTNRHLGKCLQAFLVGCFAFNLRENNANTLKCCLPMLQCLDHLN